MKKPLNLICPLCRSSLTQSGKGLECTPCAQIYPIINGIPSLIKTKSDFYSNYYKTPLGALWAKGHVGFKNPLLNILLGARTAISIVGKRQRFFKKIIRKKQDAWILDLGCGGGHDLFTRYGNVAGVDLELAPLKSAKNIYQVAVHADISCLPFEDETFDYVVSSDVIGHIPIDQKKKLLSEIRRVLKKGGITAHAIETHSCNFLYRFAQDHPDLFKKSFIEDIGGHFGLEMPQAVLNRFKEHGFNLVKKEKIWGPVWSTEEYVYRFDNGYTQKSKLIKVLVITCKLLNKNILVHAIANVFLGILNYFVESLTPFDHAQGILLAYRKSNT